MSHYIDAPWRHDPPMGFSIYKPYNDKIEEDCLVLIEPVDTAEPMIRARLWALATGNGLNPGTHYKLPLTWVGTLEPMDENGLVLAAKLRILHGIDMRGLV